jgi:1-deoxy-D-xylulose-5-phosphate synthase
MARFLQRRAHSSLVPRFQRIEPSFFDLFGAPGRGAQYLRYPGRNQRGFLSRFTNNEALYSDHQGIKYIGPIHGHDVHAMEEGTHAGKVLRCPGDPRHHHPEGKGFSQPCSTRQTSSMP